MYNSRKSAVLAAGISHINSVGEPMAPSRLAAIVSSVSHPAHIALKGLHAAI